MSLDEPIVMGIINATPDSFYAPSRVEAIESIESMESMESIASIESMARRHLDEGAAILDVGACSTRPSSAPISEAEELARLDAVLPALRRACPDAIVSVDTFRPAVARHCAERYAIDIINDISGGSPDMFSTVADLRLPYILTYNAASTTAESPSPSAAARYLAERLQTLNDLGATDVILDPGIGFGQTPEQSFAILAALPQLIAAFPNSPWLVGLSRKRIVYQTLGITPDEALNGTTVLNTIALQAGAHILRVHDVRPARESITLLQAMKA